MLRMLNKLDDAESRQIQGIVIIQTVIEYGQGTAHDHNVTIFQFEIC